MNVFSNSFDEGAKSLDMKVQRNCKSSTRMLYKTQKGCSMNPQIPIPLLHNVPCGNGVLTSGSQNRKQGSFNNFMKTKNIQSSYQQAILSQLQMQRANTQNSFDMNQTVNDRDLSNRSVGVLTPGGSQNINNSFIVNQYFGKTMTSSNMPITPHGVTGSIQQLAQASTSQIPRTNQSGEQQSMDPYTYLRWKQQKYKSCRSNQAIGNAYHSKQNAHIIANSAYLLQQKKGNQTQKTKNNNKSICSSTGSALGSASMTTTMTGIKSLSEVKNPSMFIQWRFSDRKLTELTGISLFKNLTDLDISGNMLQAEILELKQLQFLKKLNLSNNMISDLYSLPHNLEILNISANILKKLNPEITVMLKNLTTLDISSNGLESLEGIQNIKRLKRLLSKNNQIIDFDPLKELQSLIEIDLENNPIDSFKQVLALVQEKKDILILNLKMSPIILMISNYDQLISDIGQASSNIDQTWIENLKLKLKFYSNGSLYRSKRVYIKIKTMQQHSKRSSSNFSNGSSSCGRAGANTGGRNNQTTVALGNNSVNMNAFSPLLNNTVTTPNYQHISQRLEDIEQLYDEILDEEEEIERKQIRIQKRKIKKQGLVLEKEDQSEDDDESLFEDEEFNNPSMSCEEDLEDLQSFRNHGNNQFLNESTADFNKEIKMINQELRDQSNCDIDNFGANPDHIQSLHSTQTVSTTKKNPISFKLDLSKCTQQQSEDDEFDNVKALNEEDEENFEIPDLQFIKVTDDSFRQMQKQQSQQQSLRNKLENVTNDKNSNVNQKYTERSQTSKLTSQQVKQNSVFIPKLKLGVLQQNQSQQSFNPIKQNHSHLEESEQKISLQSIQFIPEKKIQSSKREEQCQNSQCIKIKSEIIQIKTTYEKELYEQKKECAKMLQILEDIKNILKYEGEIFQIPSFIKTQKLQIHNKEIEIEKLKMQSEEYEKIVASLRLREEQSLKSEDQSSLISQLRYQLSILEKESIPNRPSTLNGNLNLMKLNSCELKPTQCINNEQNKPSANQNPSFLYQTESYQIKKVSSRIEEASEELQKESDQIQTRQRRQRVACDIKRVKRPESVVGHRKSSYCVKINSLLKLDQTMKGIESRDLDDTQYANEYGSTQEYPKSGGDRAMTQLSQTSTRKVGHFIERLKERNSSLQERLNGSFGSMNNPLKTKASPLNVQKVNLNYTQQQEILSCNPYIISPSNDEAPIKSLLPQSATNQLHTISSFTNQLIFNQKISKLQEKPDSSSSLNEYSGREYNQGQQQIPSSTYNSKTQRIQVKKVQYNQLFVQGNLVREDAQNNLNTKSKELSSDYQINFNQNSSGIIFNKDPQTAHRPHANSSSFVEQSRKASDLMDFYPSQMREELLQEKNSQDKFNNNSMRDSKQAQNISYAAVPTKQRQNYEQIISKQTHSSHSQW